MKDRLTGAIILVVLIVLLVPELLSGPRSPAKTTPAVASNSPEEPPLRSYTINLADEARSQPDAAATSGPAMPQSAGEASQAGAQPSPPAAAPPDSTSSPADTPKAVSNAQTPVSVAAKPAPPAAKPPTRRSTSSAATGWVVQLGVFASRENAERLAVDVRAKGFKVSVSPVTGGSRKLYRVSVGPAPDRGAAQDLQSRLRAAGRPAGTIVPNS